jgi:prepilin-type N-terminal cleavage/methylation domain-containing protein
MSRGFTLIEAMITVALVGIVSVIFGNVAVSLRRDATELALREHAWQAAEYEASVLARGETPNEQTRQVLLAQLPQGRIEHVKMASGAVITRVSWRGPHDQRSTVELAVFMGAR